MKNDISQKWEFLYEIERNYYIIGSNACFQCNEQEIIQNYLIYKGSCENKEFMNYPPQIIAKYIQNDIGTAFHDVFKKIYDYLKSIDKTKIGNDEIILLKSLIQDHGDELDLQIEKWKKASLCYDLIQANEGKIIQHPWA